MRTLAVWTLTLLGACALNATDYWVSPSGNDSGPGTQAAPWRTGSHAMNQMASGDTLYMRAGTYATFNVNLTNLTIKSWPGERATIASPINDSNIQNGLWVYGSGLTLTNLDIEGGYYYALKFENTADGGHVTGCRIHGSGRDCVKIVPNCDNITIEECEVYDSGMRDPSNADGIDNSNGDYMVVRNCFIHDIATAGTYAKAGAIGVLYEGCLVMNTGQEGIGIGQDSTTNLLDPTQNPGYHENIDGTVRNCIIVNTQGAGVAARAALRPKFYNNTLINVAETSNGGLYMTSKTHNSVVRKCEDVEFINNIIVQTSSASQPMVFITSTGLLSGLTMSNNRYYKVGGTAQFWDARVGAYGWSLAQWKSNQGTDGNSTEGNPGLDASWHLASGSACESTGAAMTGFSTDYDGNTRSAPWDIGADESGGTALTTPPPSGTVGTGGSGGSPPPPPPPPPPPAPPPSGSGSVPFKYNSSGCTADTSGSGLWLLLGALWLVRRRRRRA